MSLPFRLFTALACAGLFTVSVAAQSSQQQSSSSSSTPNPAQQEKAPSLVDPAGPTVSLVTSEPLFLMASALNACGYDEGLEESAPIRAKVREELNQAFTRSEDARNARDKVCLYIAQHRMTGTVRDIAQYISLALYLTPPPELETSVELTEMPPDAVSVSEILPLLRTFVQATDLHGIWLATHRTYDEEIDQFHDSLSKMIVNSDLYLKKPAETYTGRRFVVVVEPMLNPRTVNARIYGTDYVVVLVAGERQDPHERRAARLSALPDRAAALCARQRDRPHAADFEGDSRGAAGVPLSLGHGAADGGMPDQGD